MSALFFKALMLLSWNPTTRRRMKMKALSSAPSLARMECVTAAASQPGGKKAWHAPWTLIPTMIPLTPLVSTGTSITQIVLLGSITLSKEQSISITLAMRGLPYFRWTASLDSLTSKQAIYPSAQGKRNQNLHISKWLILHERKNDSVVKKMLKTYYLIFFPCGPNRNTGCMFTELVWNGDLPNPQFLALCQFIATVKGDNNLPLAHTATNKYMTTFSFALSQVITLEGWVDIMYFVMDAHSFYNFIYFILLIIVSYPSRLCGSWRLFTQVKEPRYSGVGIEGRWPKEGSRPGNGACKRQYPALAKDAI